ncbi:arabinogalactan protein 13-like [Rhododendron vialii]|uniref:arabinogalactan protein 13-like n=1 Tax=Rhododendron vialii TaxID=182163 RepID=UPI00265E3372|nr:arabinogalactan protein 13-like [Rhododendron vialii]
MEAMKVKLFVAVVMMVVAVSAVQNVGAAPTPAHAPAPSPVSDAGVFVPTAFASLVALAFGLLF